MPEITEEELSPNAKSLWLKALSAVQSGNHDYAIKLLLSVTKEAPGFLEGRKVLRKCEAAATGGPKKRGSLFGMKTGGGLGVMKLSSMAKKNPEGAIVAVEEELVKDPYSPELNEVLFEAAAAHELPQTAAFALETVRKGHPESTKLMHKLAEFYRGQEDNTKAAEVYRDILKHDATDSAAIKGEKDSTARASMQKQNWSEDADARSLRRNREEDEELEKRSRTGLTKEQLEERRDELIAKYNEDSNNLAVVKELAGVLERLEDWEQAKAFYEWAFSLSSGDVALRAKMEAMSDRAKELELQELERRVSENPDDAEAKQRLEERRKERVAESVEEAKRRVDQNPTDPALRYELGKALFDSGDFGGAIPHLQQAKRNPHIQSKVLLLLGRTFKKKNMLDMGVKQLEKALEDLIAMDATRKEVLYEKGLMHEEMGDSEAALECFKEIYEVDYGYRDVAPRVEASYTG